MGFSFCGSRTVKNFVAVDVEEPSAAANDSGRVQSLLDLREIDEQFHSQIHGV